MSQKHACMFTWWAQRNSAQWKGDFKGLHPLTMVDICGWYLRAQGWAGMQSLCWITPAYELSSRRQGYCVGGPLRGAHGAHSAPVACCTPPGPPAPPTLVRQACPLESRATTTQMLSVCPFQCAGLLCVCVQSTLALSRTLALCGTHYTLWE